MVRNVLRSMKMYFTELERLIGKEFENVVYLTLVFCCPYLLARGNLSNYSAHLN